MTGFENPETFDRIHDCPAAKYDLSGLADVL
jgi:hypothetical protein